MIHGILESSDFVRMPQEFDEISQLIWRLLLVNFKSNGRFCHILVVFSENMNFKKRFDPSVKWEEKEIILTSNSCLWPRPSSAFGPWQPRNKIKCGFDLEIYRPIGPQQKRLRQHWHFREMRPLPLGYLNA